VIKASATRFLVVIALLAAGCAQVAPATGAATPSGSGSPTATSTVAASPASMAPCGPSNRCLALVTLLGGDLIVVRDVTDIAHPRTVGVVGQVPAPVFLNGSTVTYADGTDMWAVPVGGSADRKPPPYPGVQEFAWSPDGKALVDVHGDPSPLSGKDVDIWKEGAWFTPIGSIPPLGVGGCETIAGCTIPNWLDFRLLYSPDGTQISLVADSFLTSVFRVWSADGKLVKIDDSRNWTMSTWSGNGLYFRTSDGVSVMRNGTIATFLPGVAWIKPTASPGGGTIAYSARDAGGWAHTFVVETATGKIRELNRARTGAVFLTSRFIWYQGERACVPADGCGENPPIHPLSGKTYIYDLQDGTETESIITHVYDVWPHAA
jgi:hypothetical protein